jgi:hypothetical protein
MPIMVSPPTLWCFANVMGSGKFLFRDPTVAECVLSITARRELAQRLNTPYALDRLVAAVILCIILFSLLRVPMIPCP